MVMEGPPEPISYARGWVLLDSPHPIGPLVLMAEEWNFSGIVLVFFTPVKVGLKGKLHIGIIFTDAFN